MGLEDELGGMLVESVGELSPPVAVMVAEGKLAGRRRIRVRRAARVAGAAVVVAVLVSAGVLVGPGRGTPRPAGTLPVAGAGPSAGGSASPTATAEPATAVTTWQAMLKVLSDTLPRGGRLANLDPFVKKVNSNPGVRYVELQYDDGHGASTVTVTLSHPAAPALFTCADWQGGEDEGTRGPGNEKPVCQETTLPDGSLMRSYITGISGAGMYDEVVQLTRPDGDGIRVTAANGTLDQDSGNSGHSLTVTRDRPPLGLAGWQAVARSPKWQWKVPPSVVEAGADFARQVSRSPCPKSAVPADCVVD